MHKHTAYSVAIYSQDEVRGKILVNALMLRGINTILYPTFLDIKNAAETAVPDVLIFDTKTNFWSEYKFFRTMSFDLPDLTRIVLCDSQHTASMKAAGMKNCHFVPDPFDPEFCISLVENILLEKEKKKTLFLSSVTFSKQ